MSEGTVAVPKSVNKKGFDYLEENSRGVRRGGGGGLSCSDEWGFI